MRALVAAGLAVIVLAVTGTPAPATHLHGRVVIGIGPFWWGAPYGYWPYSYPYPPYYPPYYYPPPVIVQEPPVYIERPAPPAAGPYWYYCESAHAYYPTAPTCPEPWIRVPPRPE